LTTALSARNAKVQRLRRLAAQRRERAEEGAFVVEGWKLVEEALATGFALEAVFVAANAVDRELSTDVPVHVVEERALASALDTTTPQGVAAIARIPAVASDWFEVGQHPLARADGGERPRQRRDTAAHGRSRWVPGGTLR
jgi:TrmH family RNA methyltransferase